MTPLEQSAISTPASPASEVASIYFRKEWVVEIYRYLLRQCEALDASHVLAVCYFRGNFRRIQKLGIVFNNTREIFGGEKSHFCK